MKIYYLKTGEKCKLIDKLDDKYLVSIYYEYNDYEGNSYEELSDSVRLVGTILNEIPTAKMSEEYNEILAKIKIKKSILRGINLEIEQCKNKVSELKNWQIDLSKYKNAKTLVFFNKNSGRLITTSPVDYKDNGYKLNFSINVFDGEINYYGCGIDYEGRRGWNNETIDLNFGILINPSDDEIINFVHKRYKQILGNPKDFNSYDISYIYRIPEKYQSADLINAIKDQQIESNKAQIKNKKEEIKHKKEELLKIENEYRDLIK